MNEKATQYIAKLIPNIGDRSMNDPAYLVSSSRVAAGIEEACRLADLNMPRRGPWWCDPELSACMKDAIRKAAIAAMWAEVIFKGGQIIFIAEIQIVK